MNIRYYLPELQTSKRDLITRLIAVALMVASPGLPAGASMGHRIASPLMTHDHRGSIAHATMTQDDAGLWNGMDDYKAVAARSISGQAREVMKKHTRYSCNTQPLVEIYIYDSNHNPVNMTGIDSYQEPIVVDAAGNKIGTVGTGDWIYNSAGTVIGYITITNN